MKIRAKIFIVLFISFSFSVNSQDNKNNKLTIKYLTFEKFGNSQGLNRLFLEVKNNTLDTLYFSRKNIIIEIFKNNKKIENKVLKSTGQVIYRPSYLNKSKIDRENAHEKRTSVLRYNYAKKIFHKNFGRSESNEEFIIQVIQNDCIVLLPNESINYGVIFNNTKYDKTCKVSVKYIMNSRFSSFVRDNKVIYIYDK
ncbi:hypothetical protein AB9T89_18690 [Flavobacterium oncorhynchi]|uniref:hypothetical protein n=1 Tax=Flavobacterium oncorhynchi TaxID=728056 RepID=UPI00351A722B